MGMGEASTDSGLGNAIDDLGMAASSSAISGGADPGPGPTAQASGNAVPHDHAPGPATAVIDVHGDRDVPLPDAAGSPASTILTQPAVPVHLPSQQQPELRLVRTDLFDRLEEHRSNEKNWTSEACLFVGAILGVFANAATSGTMGAATWVLAAAFVLMASFLSFHAWEERRRGAQARRDMMVETGPHPPPV